MKARKSKTMNNLPTKIVSMSDRADNEVESEKGKLTNSYERQEDM